MKQKTDLKTMQKQLEVLRDALFNGDHPKNRNVYTVEDLELLEKVVNYEGNKN